MVELLSDMLVKQDAFVSGISRIEIEMSGLKNEMGSLKKEVSRVATIQERQEKLMLRLLEIMDDDVPKFDQIIDIEHLKDGSVILKKHH